MSWAVGYSVTWQRDIGYGVPATCDHRGCGTEIDRGLSYVCGGEPFGGEHGCGLHFCAEHLWLTPRRPQRCARCLRGRKPFTPAPDRPEWMQHKLTDESWQRWRDEHPTEVEALKLALAPEKGHPR